MGNIRFSRRDAALVKACATAHGVGERAVRQWRINDDPRWNTFLVSRARMQELPICTAQDPTTITPADEESAALRRFDMLQKLCDTAIERQDNLSLTPLLKSTHEAHRLLEQVRRARLAHEEASGKLVDRNAAREVMLRFFELSRGKIERLPESHAKRCNPTDPDVAMIVLEEWASDFIRTMHQEMGRASGPCNTAES
jgi:hypothetical protein